MTEERKRSFIKYSKYETNDPDYHYKRISKKKIRKFNAIDYARYQIEIELLRVLLQKHINENLTILDVGCGDNVLFHLLNKKIKVSNFKLYGIDDSEIALRIAKEKNPNVVYKNADVNCLPFEDNFFDIIVSFDVIEHIPDPRKMLSEIKRVGKFNASIIIGTPIKISEHPHSILHYQEFFPHDFKALLGNYFDNIKIIQTQSLLLTLLYNHGLSIFKINERYFRCIINLLTIILNKNLFFKSINNTNEKYSYMFGIGKITR